MKKNLKSQARVKSEHQGLWVYCIRPLTVRAPKNKISGIQSGTKVYSLPFKDIEALVSHLDTNQFNEKHLRKKLENDRKWTERSIKLHHQVIVKAGNLGAVVPMKFGTLFKTKKGLEAMLKKYYRKFKNLLEYLKDKQEWGLKVYLDSKKFVEQLKKKDRELRQFEKRKTEIPEGMRWYLDRKIDKVINQKLDNQIEEYLAEILEELKQYAEKIVINTPLPKELTGRDKDMVLNSACLIKKKQRKSFKKVLEKIFKEFYKSGFELEMTGPWPPYNFVKIKK